MSLGECLRTTDPPQTVAHADPEGAGALHEDEVLRRNAYNSFSPNGENVPPPPSEKLDKDERKTETDIYRQKC